MRAGAQVQAAIELLDESITSRSPADRIMANYFRQRRYIGSKDKKAISQHFYAVLRNRLPLEFLLSTHDVNVTARSLIAAQLQCEGEVVSEYFAGDKYSPARLSDPDLAKLGEISLSELESAPTNVQFNVPEWLEPSLLDSLGESYKDEMMAISSRAPTDLRVNLLKVSREELLEDLDNQGVSASDTRISPWGLRLESKLAVGTLDSFKKGWFEIQDEGSQLLALVADPRPGQTVVDFCAGAGGKSLAMAALMQNKGSLYACDVHSKRLEQLSKRAKRAGVHNIRVNSLSSEHDKWVKKHKGKADLVLVDAPCTGTGTWRRNPDSRWNLQPTDVANLTALQQSVLQSASRLVKPGGRLIYATCSLLEEENQRQAQVFLDNNQEFEAAPLPLESLPEGLSQRLEKNQLRLLTSIDHTDGFYLAAFKRKPE